MKMEIKKQLSIANYQKMKISSLSLDKDDLKKFCDTLQERSHSASEIEIGTLQQKEDESVEQFEKEKKIIKDAFELKITVSGKDGESLRGTINDVFSSVNFPEEVKSLYVDSESTLRYTHNYYPSNLFKIFLDFNKPKIFDFSLMPSQSTPNGSNIEVNGYDPTWVNGVFSEIKKFVDSRSSTLSIVHSHSIYDIMLWVLGLPASFWVCNKLSTQINAVFSTNTFATSALYLYTFLVTLFIFRVLFHYLRWVCPLVEYRCKNNRMLAHKAALVILGMGWFAQFIYDIAKWLIKT